MSSIQQSWVRKAIFGTGCKQAPDSILWFQIGFSSIQSLKVYCSVRWIPVWAVTGEVIDYDYDKIRKTVKTLKVCI